MNSRRNPDDERLKAEFIKKKGVTVLPAFAPSIPPVGKIKMETPLRVAREKIYTPITLDPGPKPLLLWVTADQLHINPSYQRTISTSRGQTVIKGIVEHFSWKLFTPLTLTPREEGGYWVIDGQHRAAAARMRGIREIPAILLENMPLDEQARVFAGINGKRVTVNAYAMHHALLASGDPVAVTIRRVTDAAGVTIPSYPKSVNNGLHPNETLALGCIRSSIKKYGESAVIEVLKKIRQEYPTFPGMLTKDRIIQKLERRERARTESGND